MKNKITTKKQFKKKLRSIVPVLLTTTMIFSQVSLSYGATAATYIDEFVLESEKLVDGLTYQHKVRLTNLGNVDIYTLVYEANSPNVELEIFRSDDLGKREKLTDLAKTENIIAGVNASFFDMSRNYSDILGIEKDNGEIFYARDNYNATPQAAALMIGEDETMFNMGYIVPQLELKSDSGSNVTITGYNTVSSFHNATVIKGDKIDDTSYIDKNYSVYKVICDSDLVIKKVVPPKTNVAVADDEYLITLPEASYKALIKDLDVGDQFTFNITANTDLSKYESIVSGGGTLVKDGKVSLSGIQVSSTSRQPRSAIGITADGDIIEMVVDGRGDSLGATLEEMANYMIKMGAVYAISLDGGGSSEIVKKDNTGTIRVENKPSDGVERKVVNGVGFKATLKTGVATQVQYLNDNRTVVGYPLTIQVLGKDEYYNNVNLDKSKITYEVTSGSGYFNGSDFIAQAEGPTTIMTYYNGTPLSAQEIIVSPKPTEIFFEETASVIQPGKTLKLTPYTLDKNGYKYPLTSGVTWSVDNSSIATVNNGVVTAGSKSGKVVVTATSDFGTASKAITIGQDKTNVAVSSFEVGETVTTSVTPSGVDGKAMLSKDWVPNGKYSVKLRYGFTPKIDEKQTVSAVFSGIKFNKADRIKFDMTTPAMKNAVTMTIVDSTGASYRIEMADGFAVGGKRTLVADLPDDISYPATLKSINVEYQPSAEKTTPEVGAIYFDNIMTEVDNRVAVTQPVYPKTDTNATSTVSTNRLSVVGSVKYPTNSQQMAVNSLEPKGKNSTKTYVSKVSPTLTKTVTNTKVASDAYAKYEEPAFDANVYTLKSSGSTILTSQPEQWNKLLNDIQATSKKNIIIIANKSPLADGYDETESEVIQTRLSNVAQNAGKNIYFINGTSNVETPTVTYHNNVRYIDLPQLSLSNNSVAPWSVDFYLEDGILKYNFSK